MRQRLIARGRDSTAEIESRIERNHELRELKPRDEVVINNDQTPEDTSVQSMALIEISNI